MSIIDMMFDDETAQSGLKDMKENAKGPTNNVFYRYQNLDFGASTTVRYLPQSDKKLTGEKIDDFWLPKKVIRIRFANPAQADSEVALTIPVMQMYVGGKTENDTILSQVKALYDEAQSEEKKGHDERAKKIRANASYHWMRGESLAQGFVIRPGFVEQNIPENPIRVMELKKQILNVIKAKVNDENPDTMLAAWPVHGKHGTNFIIKKTKTADGQWPNYSTSEFANRSTPLDEMQIEALRTHGLFDLESFLPTRPTDDEYALLTEIVKLSIAGERVWNPDWEDTFTTIKIFKTNSGGASTDTLKDRIQQVVVEKTGSAGDAASIIAGLTKTGRKSTPAVEVESENDDVEEITVDAELVDAEIVEPKVETKKPLKTTEEVGAILARLRGKEKTAVSAE